jgi:competence protein ComEC
MLPGATIGLLFGVWFFQQQPRLWSFSVWLCWLAILLLSWLIAYKKQFISKFSLLFFLRKLWLILLIAALGFAWAQGRAWYRLQSQLPAACEQQIIPVQGVIVGVPERDARGQHVDFDIENSFRVDCPLPQRLRLHLYDQSYRGDATKVSMILPQLQAGERWQWSVRLKRPHGTRNPHGFDYAAWSLSNNIGAGGSIISKAPMHKLQPLVWQPSALIARWRAKVGQRIEQVLGATPQSAVVRALVIGDDSQIARKDWQLFVDTGINHLVSISGLHITMLASLGYLFTGWIWRLRPQWALYVPSKLAAGTGGAMIAIIYSALAGFSIPTQRTLYMLLTIIAMLSLNRQLPFSWILSIAIWVVLFFDPWAVISSGFWLSFGAVSVLAFAMAGRLRPAPWWQNALHTQWVITLAFVPVLILMFNQLSLISPLANGLAIPVVSLGVVPLAIAGAILPLDFLLHVAATLWEWCAQGLHWLRHMPDAVLYLATPSVWAWCLAMIGTLVWLLPRGWPLRWAGLLLWLPLILPTQAPLQPGQMQVTVMDVGQGLSVLVRTAHHTLLYDAGPAYNEESDAGQRIVLPYLRHMGVHDLEMAVVSHDDNDHVGGMASVFAGVSVNQLLSSLTPEATFFKQIQNIQNSNHLQQRGCVAGQQWQWDGVFFQVLSPAQNLESIAKDNDKSCVIHIRSAHGSMLLTGDIEKDAERRLLQTVPRALAANVVTIPHHGSKTSSSTDFIAAVQPEIAIASVGYLNRFGHPKGEIVSRYEAVGAQVLRSDTDGAVLLNFVLGQAPNVQTWRKIEPHYWEL